MPFSVRKNTQRDSAADGDDENAQKKHRSHSLSKWLRYLLKKSGRSA